MLKKILALLSATLLCLLTTNVANAETIVSNGYLYDNQVWSASGSPYIIEDTVTVPTDRSLVIEPGVSIIASSTVQGYSTIENHGQLQIDGTEKQPITFQGFGQLMTWGGTTTIKYAEISLEGGLGVLKGLLNISSSSISNSTIGLDYSSGKIEVNSSTISGNSTGLHVQNSTPKIVPMMAIRAGMNNVVPDLSAINLTNSRIIDNTIAINNASGNAVNATDNWWGSDAGPSLVGDNQIIGAVNYNPWLKLDPSIKTEKICCSNILFIPGLEGTRLYRDERGFVGTSTNQLWEPNRNVDVKKLFLNVSGSSTDKSIYTGEPIDKALGIFNVYGKFLNFLDSLKKDNTINTWKSYGYDWRLPIPDVVMKPQRKSTGSESLSEVVQNLASSSKTGKVSIIAHSNGGLVAKYLIKYLGEIGKLNLVDTVFSVAVPNLGTPEAIAGLLHGDNQSIASGLILTKAVARDLGVNMPSAYSLLPSAEYFRQIFSPTIAFASTTIKGLNDGSYPKEINSVQGQSNFIIDSSNVRKVPKSAQTTVPIKGNSALLFSANLVHDVLDSFSWPSIIKHFAIVGWNNITTKGLEYFAPPLCQGIQGKFDCGKNLIHQASTTLMGDGTVVAPSASAGAQNVISENLKIIGQKEGANLNHVTILNSSTTQNVILGVLKDTAQDSTLPAGVTKGAPDYSSDNSIIIVRTHSPVELHIYDQNGNHTGPIPKPQNIDADSGLYQFYEEEIPGSKFDNNGGPEYAPETSIYLPAESIGNYRVEIRGIGTGEFSYDESLISNGSVIATKNYANLPATPLLVASTTLNVSGIKTASSTGLILDLNGTGKDYVRVGPGNMTEKTRLEMLEKFAENLVGKDKDKDLRFKAFRKILDNGEQIKRIKIHEENQADIIGHKQNRNMSENDKKMVLDSISREFETNP